MRAAGLTTFGPPEVLRLIELDEPRAGPGQVRVRVLAAGVMPFDVRVRAGGFPPGVVLPMPVVPGNEFAGVVDQVGEGVAGLAVGHEVFAFCTLGAYAEHVVVAAEQVVPKPPEMPWDVAGAFAGTAQGAHLAVERMGVGHGDTVLVDGAAGGLGTMAVQLAALRGAKLVIGTASAANHEYLRGLGVVPVEYGAGLVERVRAVAPAGVDTALGAGIEGLRAAVEVTADRDRVVTMVHGKEHAALGLRDWAGVRSAARLVEMAAHYAAGDLVPHIRASYPLDRAADAHRHIGGGHGRGKVVLVLA